MSAYKKSFTSKLKELEREIINEPEFDYPIEVKQSLWGLITYIESADIATSEVAKFILRNFRLSLHESLAKWNDTHIKPKTMNTLRGQVSELSSQLYEVFGDIGDIYPNLDMKKMTQINYKIDALKMREAVSIDDSVIGELQSYFINDQLTKIYFPDECRKELALIKALSKQHIYEKIDSVDLDKLLYIRRLMNQQLISTKKSDFNTEKYEMILAMKKVNINILKDQSERKGEEDTKKAEEEIVPIQVPLPKVKKLEDDYNFASMSELIQVMLEFMQIPADSSKLSDKKSKQLNMMLQLFTVDGLRKYLSGFCSADLSLYDYEKVHHT